MGKNQQKIIVAVIVVIVVAILIMNMSHGEDRTKEEIQKLEQTQKLDNWKKGNITEENIKDALAIETEVTDTALEEMNYINSITKIIITDSKNAPGKKDIFIYYTITSLWDKTHFVKTAARVAIAACSTLFQNQNVNRVCMVTETNVTDQDGKLALITGVKIDIGQPTADRIDWQQTANRSGSYPGDIYRIADSYSIYPGILKNVNTDEVINEIER